jgi:ketosteroid isomerase-like protein
LEITKANSQFYNALNILFTGNSDAILNVWSHSADISYLGPWGKIKVGWDSIKAEFIKVGSMKIGGNIESKNLIVGVGSDMAYTVCDEVGENKDSTGQSFFVNHRATNIFRLEQGEWKLVHHHTDISPQLQKAYTVNK